jgi:predicted acetyltransferase
MNSVEIDLIQENKLNHFQLTSIRRLQAHCFAQVDPRESEENFIAESYAKIIAKKNDNVIGYLSLYFREIIFDENKVILGGIGGVCVAKPWRRKGIATKMMKKGLLLLEKRGCDVACLNANEFGRHLYESIGFEMMNRKISFENIHGDLVFDEGTMFMPLLSNKVFNDIMNSKVTFHYGKGYW